MFGCLCSDVCEREEKGGGTGGSIAITVAIPYIIALVVVEESNEQEMGEQYRWLRAHCPSRS